MCWFVGKCTNCFGIYEQLDRDIHHSIWKSAFLFFALLEVDLRILCCSGELSLMNVPCFSLQIHGEPAEEAVKGSLTTFCPNCSWWFGTGSVLASFAFHWVEGGRHGFGCHEHDNGSTGLGNGDFWCSARPSGCFWSSYRWLVFFFLQWKLNPLPFCYKFAFLWVQ